MATKTVEISVGNLAIGMYVSALDRPWEDTPFQVQGFTIKSSEEIALLQTHCDLVYIEVEVSGAAQGAEAGQVRTHLESSAQTKTTPNTPVQRPVRRKRKVKVQPAQPIDVKLDVYETTSSLRNEAENARNIARNLRGNLSLITRQISRGKLSDYEKLKNDVNAMVDSVLACPDAFAWIVRLRDKDQHSHDHSLRAALWAVQFGRYIGMDKAEMVTMCLGCLLKDIGKTRVANSLLRKPDRTEQEQQEYQAYVGHGVDMLRDTGQIEPKIMSTVRYHAERNNGTGFPDGVTGIKIPLLARIAGISAAYDLINHPRDSGQSVALSRAVGLLYNMKGEEFQEDLVLTFIRSVGLYPAGTLIELTNGDIGVIVEQHPKSRLSPQIAVLNNKAGDLNENIFMIDLKDIEATSATMAKHGRENPKDNTRIAIARDLDPTGYDVDLSNIFSFFVNNEKPEKQTIWQSIGAKLGFDRKSQV